VATDGDGIRLVVVSGEHRIGRREFYGRTDSGRYLLVVTDLADIRKWVEEQRRPDAS
jgi:hypothetical protein